MIKKRKKGEDRYALPQIRLLGKKLCIRRHYFMKYCMKLEEAKPPLKKLVVLKCKSRRIKSLFETIEFYVGPLMRMICLVIGK